MKRVLLLAVMASLVIAALSRLPISTAAAGFSAPAITSVAPAAPVRNARPQALTVTGSDFQSGLSLAVTSPGGQTTIVRGKDLLAQRATSFQVRLLIDTKGVYSLVVTNPDGGASAPFDVEVK